MDGRTDRPVCAALWVAVPKRWARAGLGAGGCQGPRGRVSWRAAWTLTQRFLSDTVPAGAARPSHSFQTPGLSLWLWNFCLHRARPLLEQPQRAPTPAPSRPQGREGMTSCSAVRGGSAEKAGSCLLPGSGTPGPAAHAAPLPRVARGAWPRRSPGPGDCVPSASRLCGPAFLSFSLHSHTPDPQREVSFHHVKKKLKTITIPGP